MSEPAVFRERGRAESFGGVAEQYDRFRPDYPEELIADLAAGLDGRPPRRVLDLGCGTGKATRQLVAHGLDVLGVEIDERMAEVARSHGLTVEIGSFETWPDARRRFDLITAAQAWHWVDPAQGVPKAARLLEAGGHLALFWNFDQLAPDVQAAVDEVYRRIAPQLLKSIVTGGYRHQDRGYAEPIESSGLFEPVRTRSYRGTRTESAAQWIARCRTHSDHLQLPAAQLDELSAQLAQALAAIGDTVISEVGTYLLSARRAA